MFLCKNLKQLYAHMKIDFKNQTITKANSKTKTYIA